MTLWSIDFYGRLLDEDQARLSASGMTYEGGGSDAGPEDETRAGVARHVVTVEADDANAAVQAVQDGLGSKAAECSDWHAAPA